MGIDGRGRVSGIGSRGVAGRSSLAFLLLLPVLFTWACSAADPRKVLAVEGLQGYWVVDTEKSQTNYIVPTIRFALKNVTAEPISNIQATATFRRKGEDSQWGDSFVTVANRDKPLAPGQSAPVEMRSSADYYTPGAPVAPEIMFQHGLFRDATVEVFLRVGRSGWVKMASAEIPRRLNPPTRDPAP
jgi:hypothetical protein